MIGSRLLLVLFAALAGVEVQAAPRLWGSLEPGPHAVGFQLFAGESAPGSAGWKPRAIEIAVWYPADRPGEGAPITYGGYFSIAEDLRQRSAAEGVSYDDLRKTLSAAITGDAAALAEEEAQRILDLPMFAYRDARPRGGPFPVVIWSARYGTVAAQAVLSELLASHGAVVAAVRPKEARERLPFEVKTAEEKLDELESQTDDLRGALKAVRALPVADDARAAVVAWSYAGESAWRLAQGDARIELVVALDTNVASNWVYQSAGALETIGAVPAGAPLLVLNRLTPGLEELAHGNFNTIEGMIPGVLGIERVQRWSKGGAIARTGYESIASRVASALSDAFARPRPAPYERLEIATTDKSVMTAELYRARNAHGRCAALFHQSGSSRGEYRAIAPELVRLGFTLLAADVRWGNVDRWNDVVNESAARHGTPAAMAAGDRERIKGIKAGEGHDLDAAIDWLRRNGCSKPVVVWGASIQANGVFELATRRPADIAAIVDVSPGEYAKDEPERMRRIAGGVRTPSLVLWGRSESEVSRPVFDALPEGAKWSYASTGRHGNAIFFEDPLAWTHVRKFLATFAD